MPPRSSQLVVVLTLFAAVCAVVWLARGDAAAPAASVGAVAPSANDVAPDVARTEPGAIAAAPADVPTEMPSPRAELAVEPQSLHGIVVDEAGRPVAEATIASMHDYMPTPWTTTGADGRFVVNRDSEDRASHVELRAVHTDFDVARAWGRWGSDDVRLVLRARVPIEVRVVDENGDPVRITGATCEFDSSGLPGGITELVADGDAWRCLACRGINILSVEFAEAPVAHEEVKRRQITFAEPGPVQIRFVAATMLPCQVRVIAPDGVPVANAKVELIDGRGGAVTAYQRTVDREFSIGPVEVGKAKSDATGTARIAGPVGRPLVVRATRDGFASGLVADVRVPGSEAVVVRLGRGASGSGRLLADPLLAERIAAGDCGLIFTQAAGNRWWPDPETSPDRIALGTDGSFRFSGAPPGVWNVRWFRRDHPASVPRASAAENCGVSIELHEGDNQPLVVDLRAWRWTEVNLRVRIEGRTARDATVTFAAITDPMVYAVATCDAEGRCWTRLRPGSYRVDVDGANASLSVVGDRVDRELDLRLGEMEATFVDTKGNPVRGLQCCALMTVEVDSVTGWTHADGDGVFRQQCSAGEWAVFAWSRQLQGMSETIDWSRDDVLLQMARARRMLGTVTVRAGETTKATLVVPDDVPR